MKRREFLAVAGLAGIGTLSQVSRSENGSDKSQREYYELRKYSLKSAEKQKLLLHYLSAAAIPALNRIGIVPVGVFKMVEGDSLDLYVLLVHNSLESVV
ncbi:MAG: NIPSNAP family protein, partial [Planctomycetota bacterium]